MNENERPPLWEHIRGLGTSMQGLTDHLQFLGRLLTVDEALDADLNQLEAVLLLKRGCRRG